MKKTLRITIELDAEQFEEEGSLNFFKDELAGKSAHLHCDGYSLSGYVVDNAKVVEQ